MSGFLVPLRSVRGPLLPFRLCVRQSVPESTHNLLFSTFLPVYRNVWKPATVPTNQLNKHDHRHLFRRAIPSSSQNEARSSTIGIPRPYQKKGIEKAIECLNNGKTLFGMALPTGSGKTFIMMHIIMEHLFGASSKSPSTTDQTEKAVLGKKGKALILVHKLDLVDQTLSTARRTFGNRVTIEVEQGQRTASGQADIIIASVPTLTHPDRLAKFNPSNFGLILVDEAHHAAAASWLRVLHHFNANIDTSSDPEYTEVADLAHPHDVPIIGFTASFIRWDKRQLRKVFREVPFYVPYRDLIRDNYLVPAVGAVARASLKLSEIKETGEEGDYNIDQLSEKVNESEVIDLVVRMWREKAYRRSTLVFCVCLDHLYNLQECFIRAGIDARSITGKTPVQERRQIMSDFGNGLFPVLLNCVVLTEGTDIPQIDCVFLARPTKSPGLLQQMIGRGLRPSPTTGKKDCLVIDIVDNESEIGSLDSIPELWSEIRKDMHGPRGGRNRKSRKSNRIWQRNERYTQEDFDTIYHGLGDLFGFQDDDMSNVLNTSKNAWIPCGKTLWILKLFDKGVVRVQLETKARSRSFWRSTCKHFGQTGNEQKENSDANFTKSNGTESICSDHKLSEAIRLSDQYIKENFEAALCYQLSRTAEWRDKAVSDKMIAYLVSMCRDNTKSKEELLPEVESLKERVIILGEEIRDVGSLKQGDVAAWLSVIQHGNKAVRDSIRFAIDAEIEEYRKRSNSNTDQKDGMNGLRKQGFKVTPKLWDDTRGLFQEETKMP